MDAPTRVDEEATTAAETSRDRWRRRLLLWVLPTVVVVAAAYLYGTTGRFVSTDNAYVQRDRVDVVPEVSGEVREVYVNENDRVSAGQPIIAVDDRNFRIAVETAESRLAAARDQVASAQASYREKNGEIEIARRTSEYAVREFQRQRELAARKLVPDSTLDSAHRSADLATGAVEVLRLQQAQLTAQLGGNPDQPVAAYPAVKAAAAELERARLDLARTRITAPQAGIVSHLPKVGGRVEIGHAAFAIVTDRAVWVEANFKETDLEWVRPGQPVKISIDTYGSHRWRGRVESIAQATGAAFSLLPPQNASGNWVKVVQRIPVRIVLTMAPDDPPLRDGMSATVDIDTGPHTHFDRWFGRSH